jgi:hypothetical protein
VVLWTLLFVVLLDVAIQQAFRMPADPRIEPREIQRYFDYGRSVEGKLRYLVRETDADSGPLARSGWVTDDFDQPVRAADPQGTLVAVYGQSMSHRVAGKLKEIDPSIELRLLGGPGAPLGHSFELYRRDRGRHEADVIVLGVVASGLHYLSSLTTMTWAFEVPAPYTYPRWVVEEGRLSAIEPLVDSLDGLRRAMRDPALWADFLGQLREHDQAFDASIFEADLADRSAVLRCIRRSLGQRHQDRILERYRSRTGFEDVDQVLTVARALLTEFGRSVRADGKVPVVLLFHDRGTADHLHAAVADRLVAEGIPFLSSHEIARADDPANFLSDGHLRRDIDAALARRLLELVAEDRRKGGGGG